MNLLSYNQIKEHYYLETPPCGLGRIGIYTRRQKHINKYGFSLLSKELVSELANIMQNKKIVEVGSGSGFLSKQLELKEIDITSIDIGNRDVDGPKIYHRTYQADAVEKIKELDYDGILMVWPEYGDPFAFNIVKQMPASSMLIYCGESNGGCTGDDSFFDLLEKEFSLKLEETKALQKYNLSFPMIHDTWEVYQKKLDNVP